MLFVIVAFADAVDTSSAACCSMKQTKKTHVSTWIFYCLVIIKFFFSYRKIYSIANRNMYHRHVFGGEKKERNKKSFFFLFGWPH